MKWSSLLIFSVIIVLVQATAGRVLSFSVGGVGTIMPDLMAVLVVFMALSARNGLDVMLMGWMLGFAVDLAVVGPTPVGPMAIAYALAAWLVYSIREAFFYDRLMTRAMLTLIFCILAHVMWVLIQSMVASDAISGLRFQLVLQAMLIAAFTAIISPPIFMVLNRVRRWFIPPAMDR